MTSRFGEKTYPKTNVIVFIVSTIFQLCILSDARTHFHMRYYSENKGYNKIQS